MHAPQQQRLFDDEPAAQAEAAAPPPTSAVLKLRGAAASLSKAQKEFNRLNERLARLRAHLSAWQAAAEVLHRRRLIELVPVQRKLVAQQRDAVLWIDAHLQQPPAGEKLAKKARAKLVALLRLLSREVLDDGPDDAVEAAHDRHSAQSFRAYQRREADLAAAMLGQALGDDALFEGDAESVEALMQRTAQRLQQQREQQQGAGDDEATTPPVGQRISRAEKARLRDVKALKEASQSVREVYRRLASSLHPDREPDAASRERKTVLMARVNQAYAANDLLALLAMQLEVEQIDADHLAGLPDDRLRHYNRVLAEQQQALESELAALQMPVSASLQRQPGLLNWPATLLDTPFSAQLRDLQQALQAMHEDLPALRDARTRQQFLRQLDVEDPDEAMSPLQAMLLHAAFDDVVAGPRPAPGPKPARGRGGGRRRR